MSQPLLQLTDCHVRYGLVTALRGVSLDVNQGEMVALLGPNGAGKSTTLRTISGVSKPYRGEIVLQGKRIDGLQPWDLVQRGIAHVPEGRYLFPHLTVGEHLKFGYQARHKHGRSYSSMLHDVFEAFPRLQERSRQAAGTLSGGEQQMLTVSIGLMSEPQLLLVDELSLGLAPKIVEQLFRVLRNVNSQGTAILLVEQFVPLALANTQRTYLLAKGSVAVTRPSHELRKDPALLTAYLGQAAAAQETASTESAPTAGAAEAAG